MRVLLIADVHANWEALLALQRAERKPDAVLFAGDAVGYGPDPANCARWLLNNTSAAVRGNHDDALHRGNGPEIGDGIPTELAQAARETLAFSRQALAGDDVVSIGNWPLTASISFGGANFFIVHGTPANPLSGNLNPATCPESELRNLFDGLAADVIVTGHTHLPALRKFDGRVIVNPGSLGQPRYGAPDATYAMWEDGAIQIRHLHYPHNAVANKLRLAPLSAETAEILAQALETGLVAI
jgi:putative phosphoesterase